MGSLFNVSSFDNLQLGQIGEAVPAMLTVKYGAKYHMWDVQLKHTFDLLRVRPPFLHIIHSQLTGPVYSISIIRPYYMVQR